MLITDFATLNTHYFICRDNSHHRSLHGQLEKVAGEAVRAGLIKFNSELGYYLDIYELSVEGDV